MTTEQKDAITMQQFEELVTIKPVNFHAEIRIPGRYGIPFASGLSKKSAKTNLLESLREQGLIKD